MGATTGLSAMRCRLPLTLVVAGSQAANKFFTFSASSRCSGSSSSMSLTFDAIATARIFLSVSKIVRHVFILCCWICFNIIENFSGKSKQ